MLILGGVRSGKSRLAERLALASDWPVLYVATARAEDAEMAERIAQHRARRHADWSLIEEPLELGQVLARECAPERCVLVDCLTLWLTNALLATDAADPPARLAQRIAALRAAVAGAPGRLILVANETNLGVVPLGELTRRFCDLAGVLHQDLAACCEQVILTVAGLPLVLKGEKS
ncbi:MAG: bifunctional adenosylcobinamide kinase/adenosylcobinamide-phosphate guanylyltransferase [Sphingobacteriia bacterium]|nr:bifunctional adenosylcobinamide kinase/adenosylcobinamide-phosphate guanylyltransferase [Sphingobacteriia bacterium]NCC39835.1 bifunctional adenosylcobinamide kinase/adenosylcobinamide-phosphate guanylyltransferase [Gammaproteobacteria bacterium]